MTVQRLIELALADIGVTYPDNAQLKNAFDHLNLIISNFGFWNDEIQPIQSFTSITSTINLPPYYCEIFELLLAAREGIGYGIPVNSLTILETKAKQLTDRLVYRKSTKAGINASGMVI